MILSHLIVFLILLLIALVYQRLAIRFKIIDVPNDRSSHQIPTVRGGGILFPAGVLLWWMAFDFQNTWMVIGILWVAAISLMDDLYSLSRKLRFGVQFLAISMAFFELDVFQLMPWYVILGFYIIGLGCINAVNFMDGINGITGLYSLVFLGSLLAINEYTPIFDSELIQYEILAICVFLIFNFRKRAMMFAGDIGSISIAYLMIYFMTQWYLETKSWTVVLVLLVYGVETILTMIQRGLNKENVLQPHRKHLYQILANEGKKEHVLIAVFYAMIQLLLNYFLFIRYKTMPANDLTVLVIVVFCLLYLSIKLSLQRKHHLN
ncbi:UDP-N-acetylmuramyl pentapeptide phosphotransferase/UDP-N-acetylglucosamine-1-phosphate transferase [Algoriphagus iocasae]|uniref:UDP-N-acetylmuramyl pentapeptide phosphotransferase/UDP-N-acetylglucosamine-1-phosphate transferase n=1 Tax=Algoriphagus iocasae TaxID=1836499 RepID=A0A841MT09_9BACT|nr:UDP-N-acetylmuramyl pentapeptide phosphotransferase/UDP-N-acetylglucosamine-1-phosphate transferase [Algoriphagus iocasae]